MAKRPQQEDSFAHLRPNSSTIEKAQEKASEGRIARAARFHKVFVQNPDGLAVMEEWTNSFMFGPPMASDATLFAAGVAEGKRQVLKDIINQINIIEGYRNE